MALLNLTSFSRNGSNHTKAINVKTELSCSLMFVMKAFLSKDLLLSKLLINTTFTLRSLVFQLIFSPQLVRHSKRSKGSTIFVRSIRRTSKSMYLKLLILAFSHQQAMLILIFNQTILLELKYLEPLIQTRSSSIEKRQ